jgi:hypothetical protein
VKGGDAVTFDSDIDRQGRSRAINVRVLGRSVDVAPDPQRRQYGTRHIVAEGPPSGRAWRARERAERLFVIPGELDV